MAGKRKRVKHYHEPGDVHELTFSCYRRLPVLTNDTWRGYLATSVQHACRQRRFRLVAFRFWQEGPGYDRNLQHEDSVLASIDYLHNNPVRRGLCRSATEWFWSSARFYATEPPRQDPRLPRIDGLPADFFGKSDSG